MTHRRRYTIPPSVLIHVNERPWHQVSLLYFSPSGFLVGEILSPMILHKIADYFWFIPSEIIHPGFTYFWCQHSGNYKTIYTKIMTPLLEFQINVFPYLQPQWDAFLFISNLPTHHHKIPTIWSHTVLCLPGPSPALPPTLWRLYFLYKYGDECIINWHKCLAYNPSQAVEKNKMKLKR